MRRVGKISYLNGKVRGMTIDTNWRAIMTLPSPMRPDIQTYFAGASTLRDHVVRMNIETDGVLYAKALSGDVDRVTFTASFPSA